MPSRFLAVIMPVRDTPAELLLPAARSVLAQLDQARHVLVVVDDGSQRPDTRSALAEIAASPAAMLVSSEGPGGVSRARNRGVEVSDASWVAFCDSDDLWLGGWVDAIERTIAGAPDLVWLSGRMRFGQRGGPLTERQAMCARLGIAFGADGTAIVAPPASTELLILHDFAHLGVIVVRREVYLRLGGLDERLSYLEDQVFLFRLSASAPCVEVDAVCYEWLHRPDSTMFSARVLSWARIEGFFIALRDPLLKPVRDRIRWRAYGMCKLMAISNVVHRRRLQATGFALRAWLFDPRDLATLAAFLRLLFAGDSTRGDRAQQYYPHTYVVTPRVGGMPGA